MQGKYMKLIKKEIAGEEEPQSTDIGYITTGRYCKRS
jgi:hypothetical protein